MSYVKIDGVRYGAVQTSVEGDQEVDTYLVESKWFEDKGYDYEIGEFHVANEDYTEEMYSDCVRIGESGYKYIRLRALHVHSL